MKVVICFPPLETKKGFATLGQNRQFQFFKEPTYIYPVVPASAATLLKNAGQEVVWLDCIAENINYEKFIELIKAEKPDLVAIETKTPVIKQIWKIINDLKLRLYAENKNLQVVLFSDHVTALAEESFKNSKVDFVLTGGDYDFLLLNLCNHLSKSAELEPGIYYRQNNEIKNTGNFKLNHDLNSAGFIDRGLTKWQLYAYQNGNYKRTPGTYIMSGRDCWWAKCSFCSWPTLYPAFRTRSPENVLDEIEILVNDYKVREIMDDTGCFPVGDWLRDFCRGLINRGLARKIFFDCNMRFGALSKEDFSLMKQANFRLLLFGLESANQKTLDRLNKNVKVEDIINDCKTASGLGLYPHITVMFGYPWESRDEALNTLRFASQLLKKGYAYTMQSTLVIPYPGTPLFRECINNGWLRTEDWDRFDMKEPVMKTPMDDEEILKLVQSMYKVSFNPEFILRKIFSLRDIDDLKYSLRAANKVFGHIFDFRHKSSCSA